MTNKRDFRFKTPPLENGVKLLAGVWYRTPLYNNDHLVGRSPEHRKEEISWCGRPLGAGRDWEDHSFGGLWVSVRKSNKCGPCAARDKEWQRAQETYDS